MELQFPHLEQEGLDWMTSGNPQIYHQDEIGPPEDTLFLPWAGGVGSPAACNPLLGYGCGGAYSRERGTGQGQE